MLEAIRKDWRFAVIAVVIAAGLWGALAYVLLPLAWRHYEHQRALAGTPMVTHSGDGIPGDPINVGLVGSREDVLCAMNAAAWDPADPITLRSSVEIIGSVLLDRPYHDAPVSSLYYQDRRQDLAFEKPVGSSADRRHHVRFWKVLDRGQEGRAVWLGAATFDRGVGFSHDDARVTHHIAPAVDAERELLTEELEAAKVVTTIYEITGVGPTLDGRNAEGDSYYTDGEIKVSVLVQSCSQRSGSVIELANPPIVDWKNRAWNLIENLLLSPPSPGAKHGAR